MKHVSTCLVCKKKSSQALCFRCLKNPFRIEEYRQILASQNDKKTLVKWYVKELPEIPNLNTSKFWDEKLEVNEKLGDQDGMTQNRIKIVDNMIDKKAKKILDIGAGHGYLEEYVVKKRKLKLFANDFSVQSVQHLKDRFKGDFQVQSLYNLQYKEKFEAVFTLEVLEHVPPSKILKVLRSIKELVRNGGQFIVSVPTNEGLEKMKVNNNGHMRMYTIPLIRAELELAGFTVEEVRTLYAFKNLYGIKNIFAKLYKKWSPNNIIIASRLI